MIILIGVAVAVLYFGLLYAAPGPDKTVLETAQGSGNPKVFLNLGLGVLTFLLLDAVIFHSGLYTMILKPKSQAGAVSTYLRAEQRRPRSADKEILVVGDSRVAQGFSSDLANEMTQGKNVAFVERAVPGTGPRIWHYFLREIDPTRNRYRMIVVPLTAEDVHGSQKFDDRPSDIVQMAPLLHYSDAFSFASSFHEWGNQTRAFTACILRGTAYQSDLFDLLEDPTARLGEVRRGIDSMPRGHTRDRNQDLTGLVIDPATGGVEEFPDGLSDRQKTRMRREVKRLRLQAYFAGKNYAWSKQIAQRYASSSTSIVFLRLPRGPFSSLLRSNEPVRPAADESWLQSHAVVLDSRMFEFLEAPEYFIDSHHLNETGQRLFTKRLTEELLARLQISSAGRAEAGLVDSLSE